MRKSKSLVVVLGLMSVAGVAAAGGRGGSPGGHDWPTTPTYAAPEIDPASASSALTLLAGGLTLLRSRSRGKNKKQ